MTGKPRYRIVEFPKQLSIVHLDERVRRATWPTEDHPQDQAWSRLESPLSSLLDTIQSAMLNHAYLRNGV